MYYYINRVSHNSGFSVLKEEVDLFKKAKVGFDGGMSKFKKPIVDF